MKYKILLFFILFYASLYSQVTVAPVTIHMSDANKNSYIVVRNNSDFSPWEVSIDMKYGYPISDTSGNTIIYFLDNDSSAENSAVKWISFFPRKFILQPKEEQTIRILAKPPKNLKDGEYWGRPVIYSRQVSNVDTTEKDQISVGLSTEFRTVIALNYRKGKVNTEVKFLNLNGFYDSGNIILYASFKREGNSAYLGTLSVRLIAQDGKIIKESVQEIAVYTELYKKINLEVGELPKGIYNVEVDLNTERSEPGAVILKGNSVNKKISIVIN